MRRYWRSLGTGTHSVGGANRLNGSTHRVLRGSGAAPEVSISGGVFEAETEVSRRRAPATGWPQEALHRPTVADDLVTQLFRSMVVGSNRDRPPAHKESAAEASTSPRCAGESHCERCRLALGGSQHERRTASAPRSGAARLPTPLRLGQSRCRSPRRCPPPSWKARSSSQ